MDVKRGVGLEHGVGSGERAGERVRLEEGAVAGGVHVGEVEHRPDEVDRGRDREHVVHRPQVAHPAHHFDAEGDEATLRLQPLAKIAELVDDVRNRLLPLAAEQEARMEDDEPCAAGLGEARGVVEHPERHLELLASVRMAHECRERSVHGEDDVRGGGCRAEERRSLVVEPEAADEADLAGPVTLCPERRERLLECRRLGQPAGAVADLTHWRSLCRPAMSSDPVSTFLACPSALPESTYSSSTSTSASPTSG